MHMIILIDSTKISSQREKNIDKLQFKQCKQNDNIVKLPGNVEG